MGWETEYGEIYSEGYTKGYTAGNARAKEKDQEIEKLKRGYCKLKKNMVQGNMKLSLENDKLRNILKNKGITPNEILYLKNEVDELNDIINKTKENINDEINLLKTGVKGNLKHITISEAISILEIVLIQMD